MYAVYVVVIEDTEEDDQALLVGVVSGERIFGGLTQEQAEFQSNAIYVQTVDGKVYHAPDGHNAGRGSYEERS